MRFMLIPVTLLVALIVAAPAVRGDNSERADEQIPSTKDPSFASSPRKDVAGEVIRFFLMPLTVLVPAADTGTQGSTAASDNNGSVAPTAEKKDAVAAENLIASLKAKGFSVEVNEPKQNKWVVDFSKEDKTKGQGLLGVHWKRQVSGQAIYFRTGPAWELVDVNVQAQEKPIIGDWAPVESDKEANAIASQVRKDYELVARGK